MRRARTDHREPGHARMDRKDTTPFCPPVHAEQRVSRSAASLPGYLLVYQLAFLLAYLLAYRRPAAPVCATVAADHRKIVLAPKFPCLPGVL